MAEMPQWVRRSVQAGVDRYGRLVPGQRSRRKYHAELEHWARELVKLRDWFVEGTTDWWGLPAPGVDQKLAVSNIWSTNAILTMHRLRPTYWEELQTGGDEFAGERVLEVGCGPLAPILQFDGCERHGSIH